jgi:microcystin-dependent protein
LSDVLSESGSSGAINLGQSPLDFQPSTRDLAFREWLLRDVLAAPAYKDHAAWVNSRLIVDGVEIPVGQISGLSGGRVPAGAGALWFSDTAPTGWQVLDGSTITDAQTLNPELWDNVASAWKSGANIVLPDLRGRVPVGKGTHGDVDAYTDNDGVAVANRSPKHNSTLTGPTDSQNANHNHNINYTGLNNATGGFDFHAYTIQAITGTTTTTTENQTHGHGLTGASVGPGGTRPIDTPAYQVVNFIIKL